MKIPFSSIPTDIEIMYNIYDKVTHNNYVYIKIIKVMYGLKQAEVLAYSNLVKQLQPHGYEPLPFTTGLWRNKIRVCTHFQ